MNTARKERLIAKILSALNEDERQELLTWALEAKKIQSNSSLTIKQRYNQLMTLESNPPIKSVLKRVLQIVKAKGWDERGWPIRLGGGGLAFGAMIFGGQAIGIAGFGTGVGVSLYLVLGFGGTFLGLLIESLMNESRVQGKHAQTGPVPKTESDQKVIENKGNKPGSSD